MKLHLILYDAISDDDDATRYAIVLDGDNGDYDDSVQEGYDNATGWSRNPYLGDDIQQWLEINTIPQLKDSELYRIKFNHDKWSVDDNEREYRLTEKQSALFILRFR